MTSWLDRLGLTPTERRIAIFGAVLLALLLNWLLIWPYFSEWGQVSRDWNRLAGQKAAYLKEIARRADYERRVRELEGAGGQVLPEEQANRVQSGIISAAATNAVNIVRITPQVASLRLSGAKDTNFFDEQVVTVDIGAKEEGLVNFLYALGASDSMIRVRDITRLQLDPTQQGLGASVTFVASFQKKARPAGGVTPRPSADAASPKPSGTNAPAKIVIPEQPGLFRRLWNSIAGKNAPAAAVPAAERAATKPNAPAAVPSRVTGTNAPARKASQ